MSAELVGILSVGATLVVGGIATAGAVVGLMLRLDSRSSGRMDAMEERLGTRMDRMDARMDRMEARIDRMDSRMDTLESRQYELVQAVVRMDATQQVMLETLTRIEERTGSAGNLPGQPALFETGSSAGEEPRQSAATPA